MSIQKNHRSAAEKNSDEIEQQSNAELMRSKSHSEIMINNKQAEQNEFQFKRKGDRNFTFQQ